MLGYQRDFPREGFQLLYHSPLQGFFLFREFWFCSGPLCDPCGPPVVASFDPYEGACSPPGLWPPAVKEAWETLVMEVADSDTDAATSRLQRADAADATERPASDGCERCPAELDI